MNLEHIREFLVYADCLSISEAARRLYISQPALSAHIAKLEEELGFPLSRRGKHGSQLTRAGRDFAEQVAPLIDQFDGLAERCRKTAQIESVTIKISNFTNYLECWPRVSSLISSDSAGLRFEVLSPGGLVSAWENDADARSDIIVTFDDGKDSREVVSRLRESGNNAVYLGKERFCMWTSSSNPLVGSGTTLAPEDLQGSDVLIRDFPLYTKFYDVSLRLLSRQGVHLNPVRKSFDDYGDYGYLDYSSMVTICARRFFETVVSVEHPDTVLIDIEDVDMTIDAYFVTRHGSNPSIDAFFELLNEQTPGARHQ